MRIMAWGSDVCSSYLFGILYVLSSIFIAFGFLLLSASWSVLHAAQKAGALAKTGPYSYIRHPQYVAFVVIMLGFLFQWPTILTVLMFPVLVVMYVRQIGRAHV